MGDKMLFYKDIYTDDSIKNVSLVKWKIRHGLLRHGMYLITIADSDNQLECFSVSMLKQKYFRRQGLKVVGITKTYDAALEVIKRVMDDTLQTTGIPDMKTYLLSMEFL